MILFEREMLLDTSSDAAAMDLVLSTLFYIYHMIRAPTETYLALRTPQRKITFQTLKQSVLHIAADG